MESLVGTNLSSLEEKYSGDRPRRLLSLDGGGILGIITLEILKELEGHLSKKTGQGKEFRLGDYFDYIAGTSTGAIIATGLALGKSVDELIEFYKEAGKEMFSGSKWYMRSRAKHTSKPLEQKLRKIIGDQSLGETTFKCLLMIVCQNATTNSPWLFSNNPFWKYNSVNHPTCNLRVPLWRLVRASTAAPTFFLPEEIDLKNPKSTDVESRTYFFVDGGVTPFNNPAFKLYRTATLPEYETQWKTGEKNLMLISVGTSSLATGDVKLNKNGRPLWRTAKLTPTEMMASMAQDQDFNCRSSGRCVFGPKLDREVNDMTSKVVGEKNFLYARFDPFVSEDTLSDLGLNGSVKTKHLMQMNKPEHLEKMQSVGSAYASKFVANALEQFETFI